MNRIEKTLYSPEQQEHIQNKHTQNKITVSLFRPGSTDELESFSIQGASCLLLDSVKT